MVNTEEPGDERLERLESLLQQLITDVGQQRQESVQLITDVGQQRQESVQLRQEVERFNEKFDNYHKATQWVVQLAFSLIAAATVTIIVSSVLGK